jgi:hypothetical protein
MKKAKFFAIAALIMLAAMAAALAVSVPAKAQSTSAASITIQVLSSSGGTTDPAPGTYTYTQGVDGSAILTATADPGWVFAYWQYFGYSPGHPIPATGGIQAFDVINQITDNPIDVTHDYNTGGYTYQYQPVFVQSDNTIMNKNAGVPVIYVVGIVAALAVVIAVAGVLAYRAGKSK